VLKELTVFALVYNLVRVVMLEAAKRQGIALVSLFSPTAPHRLSSTPLFFPFARSSS